MKNALLYYYNLNISDIYRVGNNYYFYKDDEKFHLNITYSNENELMNQYYLSIGLYNRGMKVDQFIFNNSGSITTIINGSNYVLLQSNKEYSDNRLEISLDDMIRFSNNSRGINNYTKNIVNVDWKKLWREKIDYLEYQMSQLGRGNLRIRESFNYFVGLAENAITLLEYDNGYKEYSLGHRKQKDISESFMDPTTFIIDVRVRDIAEHFKKKMLEEQFDVNEVVEYIQNSNLNQNEQLLFFARVIFPTYYFDCVTEVVVDNKDEKKLEDIIKHINSIETNIKVLYHNMIGLPRIEWLL